MYDYTKDLDRIWWYTKFIAKTPGHPWSSSNSLNLNRNLNGTIDEDIESIRESIREISNHVVIPENEGLIFHQILGFDDSVGSYKSHIWSLANSLQRLSVYINVPTDVRESFFNDDISAQELESKYGTVVD